MHPLKAIAKRMKLFRESILSYLHQVRELKLLATVLESPLVHSNVVKRKSILSLFCNEMQMYHFVLQCLRNFP